MVIAFIRFSSIGDILMTTAAVRAARKHLPKATILYITKPGYRPLLANNPDVDEVICLEGSLAALACQLARRGVTHLVDLHANLRSRLLCALLPWVSTARVQKGTAEREALILDKTQRPSPIHMADRHLAALSGLGVRGGEGRLVYQPGPEDLVDYSTFSVIGQVPYVAVAIGGQHGTKRLPVHKAIEMVRAINHAVILLGGPAEAEEGGRIAGTLALEGRWDVFNACGQLSLGQSGSVLAQAEEVYANDTGLMHMAAALGKRVHSIWGSTVPAFGMYPYGTGFTVHKISGLPCQPCHRHGLEACPLGHFKCMEELVFPASTPWQHTDEAGCREKMSQL